MRKKFISLFVRYAREVASGRRSSGERQLELCHILSLLQVLQKSQLSDASEEPIVGFGMDPSIKINLSFLSPQMSKITLSKREFLTTRAGFTPTAHTCANILSLPRATHQIQLPPQVSLFEIYDLAFSQPFFSKI